MLCEQDAGAVEYRDDSDLEAPSVDERGTLLVDPQRSVRAANAGLFVSRGRGIHPDRCIGSHELIFVRRGVLGMQEEDRRFEVRAGQALLLWPGRRHFGTAAYPRDLSFYWIHFHLERPRRGAKELLRMPQHARVERPERLLEHLHRFLDDQATGQLRPLQGSCLVLLMLGEAARGAGAPVGSEAGAVLAARAQAFLAAHYHERISASDVAAALDCNADYLGRVFRRAGGQTLTDALHRLRLKEARTLLIEDRMNVDEIARACGFDDAGYFRRIFRRHTGLSPRAFRRLHARAHVISR